MKYILQIFTGPWHTAGYTPDEIIEKIDEVASRIPVHRVILGWNTDSALYKKVGTFLHARGIQMLLWLPVFSEVSGIASPEEALDIFGRKILAPIHQEGEDFIFGCPTSTRNLQIVKEIYEQYFSDCGFDGVFLDKIRSRSFLDTQLEAIRDVKCEKYPGIEINYREDIARTNADYVAESITAVRDFGFEGASLCWNVMLAPDEHIEAIAQLQASTAPSSV